jgi:hypothetical protein
MPIRRASRARTVAATSRIRTTAIASVGPPDSAPVAVASVMTRSGGVTRSPRLRARTLGRPEELDLHRLDRVGRREAEDLAVERELRLEAPDDVLGGRKPWSSPGNSR